MHPFIFHFGLHPDSLLFVIVNFVVVILNFFLERGGFSEMLFFPDCKYDNESLHLAVQYMVKV